MRESGVHIETEADVTFTRVHVSPPCSSDNSNFRCPVPRSKDVSLHILKKSNVFSWFSPTSSGSIRSGQALPSVLVCSVNDEDAL
jgi:hypothetical protein